LFFLFFFCFPKVAKSEQRKQEKNTVKHPEPKKE